MGHSCQECGTNNWDHRQCLCPANCGSAASPSIEFCPDCFVFGLEECAVCSRQGCRFCFCEHRCGRQTVRFVVCRECQLCLVPSADIQCCRRGCTTFLVPDGSTLGEPRPEKGHAEHQLQYEKDLSSDLVLAESTLCRAKTTGLRDALGEWMDAALAESILAQVKAEGLSGAISAFLKDDPNAALYSGNKRNIEP